METSLETPKRPSATPNQVEDEEEVDSGYASKTSTPESSSFGPFVVAKTPLLSLTRRKKTKLLPFDKEIPTLTEIRFKDLRELYADNLNNLASGISKRRGILMTLKVLGESEETAEPWVFIQCDRTIAKKVRRFFKQSPIDSDFKPPNPNRFTPKLNVYVHELPPLLLGRNVAIYYERDSSTQKSLCGSKLVVPKAGLWRSATMGGPISVETGTGETADGSIQTFGITAGHFLNEDCYKGSFGEDDQVGLDVDGEETDDDMNGDVFDDGQEFELHLSSLNETARTTSDYKPDAQLGTKSRFSVGHVFQTSLDIPQDQPNLDWALFTIEHNRLKRPNIVMDDEVNQIYTKDVGNTRAVVLASPYRGLIDGIMSNSWSYLSLPPGNGKVRTKAVKFTGDQVLEPGDSGAWVVDVATNQLHGHVVASDVFGVSYVVPASDVFNDIQQQLSFKAVKLPSRQLSISGARVPRGSGLSQDLFSEGETRQMTPSIEVESSGTQPDTRISKASPGLEVFQKLKVPNKSPPAVDLTEAQVSIVRSEVRHEVTKFDGRIGPARDHKVTPTPLPDVPIRSFRDSGYSTLAPTPASSKGPSRLPSEPFREG